MQTKCVYRGMQEMVSAEAKHAVVALSPGQIWKTDQGCILITSHGERVVAYKKLRNPDQRAAVTNLIRPEALVSYLCQVGAELAESR
ncbi:MAG TPA: hypothetical protein VFE51_24925 [Verrucomicrobiae bacterium]|nr:hypothetical protein [Verrucomicrobiae bacterium]